MSPHTAHSVLIFTANARALFYIYSNLKFTLTALFIHILKPSFEARFSRFPVLKSIVLKSFFPQHLHKRRVFSVVMNVVFSLYYEERL